MTTQQSTSASAVQSRFLVLFEPSQAIVHKVANLYSRSAEDRHDLVQDIAAELWRAFPKYDSARPFTTWMYRIALNVAISHARRAGYRQTQPLESNEIAEQLVDPIDPRVETLHRFIRNLDELNRALLLLYLDGHSHRESAEVLGISESNVGTKIARLKDRIRTDPAFANPE